MLTSEWYAIVNDSVLSFVDVVPRVMNNNRAENIVKRYLIWEGKMQMPSLLLWFASLFSLCYFIRTFCRRHSHSKATANEHRVDFDVCNFRVFAFFSHIIEMSFKSPTFFRGFFNSFFLSFACYFWFDSKHFRGNEEMFAHYLLVW